MFEACVQTQSISNLFLKTIPLEEFLKGHVLLGDYRWDTTTRMIDHLEHKRGSGKLPENLQVFKMERDSPQLL